MSKLNTKLFGKFIMSENKCATIVGGLYTAAGEDSTSTGGYDIVFDTLDSSGESIGQDTQQTGTSTSTRDKPSLQMA